MSPDAELRMNVYQEGQRAYRSGVPCPYSDWRAKIWAKGYAAGQAYYNSPMYYNSPIESELEPEVDLALQALKEEILGLREEVEHLREKVERLEYKEWLKEGPSDYF